VPTAYQLLVIVHAFAGLSALATLPVPLIAKKGAPVHVAAGRVFFWAMVTVGVTGLAVAASWGFWPTFARPGLVESGPARAAEVRLELRRFAVFFACIGVLTLDAVTQGRTAFWRDIVAARRLEVPLGIALAGSGVALGVTAWMAGSLLFAAFAAFALHSALWSARWRRPVDRSRADRVQQHLQAMIGGATAALTAFSALTLRRYVPDAEAFGLAFWLVPVAMGVTASIVWSRRADPRAAPATGA